MLNKNQQKTVDDLGNCVVASCPGSGKTFTIIEKTINILESVPNSKVGLVTFTKASALEMYKRAESKFGKTDRILASTFDSLAYHQVKKKGYKMQIPTQGEYHSILSRVKSRLDLEMRNDDISEHIEFYNAKMDTRNDKQPFWPLYNEFRKIMNHLELLDFSEISRIAVNGMRDGSIPLANVTHILADEFQDTAPIQFAWIEEHIKAGVKITIVGDDDQAIYGFRNSMGFQGMIAFQKMANATMHTLDQCYRCQPEVLEPARILIEQNEERVPKNIKSYLSGGGKVSVKAFGNRDEEIEELIKFIHHHRGEDIGVLARGKKYLDFVEARCIAEGIKVQRSSNETFWDSFGASLLLNMLDSVMNDKDPRGICQALSWSKVDDMYITEVTSYVQEVGFNGELSKELKRVVEIREIHQAYKKAYDTFKKDPDHAIYSIQTWIGDNDKTLKQAIANTSESAANALVSMDRDLGRRLAKVKMNLATIGEIPEESVFLSTMHSSKGLEFEHVWIVASEEGVCPSDKISIIGEKNRTHIAEERRLFYVAMTRAKNNLIMSYSREATPTRFLIEAGLLNEEDKYK